MTLKRDYNSMSLKWTEKKGKRLLGAAARLLLPSRSLSPTDLEWEQVRSVLLVRQDRRIGDLVMNTPLFHGMRSRFPGAHISLLLRAGYEGLFADDPNMDELIPFTPRVDFYNPIGLARLVSRLRRGRFDLAIDCSNFKSFSLTNGAITLLSGAPLRVGFIDKESPSFLNVLVPAGDQNHYAANQLELLSPAGIDDFPHETRIHFSSGREERGRSILVGAAGGQGPTAIIFTGAGNETKQWGVGTYLKIAGGLRDSGVNVVLASGPGDRSLDGNPGGFPVLPELTLSDFAAAVRACGVFVSGDTGPMHVAVACGVPTVSVFLEDNIERYGYHDGVSHIAIRIKDNFGGVDDVLSAATKLVAETKQ
jgi:heptosyltransferase-3